MGGFVQKAIGGVINTIDHAVSSVGDFVNHVVQFVENVVKGVVNAIVGFVEGVITGNWRKMTDSLMKIVATVFAVAAVVVGTISGNYWLAVAGIVVLDSMYNQGQLLSYGISSAAHLETAIFHTHMIQQNAMYIQAAITLAATIYVIVNGPDNIKYIIGAYQLVDAGTLLAQAQDLQQMLNSTYMEIALGAKSIYDAAGSIINAMQTIEMLDAQLAQLQQYYEQIKTQSSTQLQQWFDVMNSPEKFDFMAGGPLYNSMAGSQLFSFASVNEPASYLLGFSDGRDRDLNKMLDGSFYDDMAGGSNFFNSLGLWYKI